MFLKANIPLSASKFASYFGNFSIKHDTARSCFQLWPKIGEGGDKISRKKTGEALAETVFFEILSPSEPILRAIIETMISPDYVLCYIPRAMAILSCVHLRH